MSTLPIDLQHKIIEFALAFVAVLLLARFSGRGGPPGPKHRR
jgi:hypothetical protein